MSLSDVFPRVELPLVQLVTDRSQEPVRGEPFSFITQASVNLGQDLEMIDLMTAANLNFEPDRPEAEILQEYVEAWDYLYEPSRYLARAYRYHLAMRPVRRPQAVTPGAPMPKDRVSDRGMMLRRILIEAKAFLKILWWQGDLRHGRRPLQHQAGGAGKDHGHYPGAADRGSRPVTPA